MPIVPDSKDWTWVLDRPCPACRFDAAAVDRAAIAGLIRRNAEQWLEVLEHPRASDRPSDDVWSALEYACHVRDVLRLYRQRLGWMLTEDDPLYPNWDQDVTAIETRYRDQVPAEVATELEVAAEEVASAFEGVAGDQWRRTGRRSDGASFTIESFGRYFVHDPIHHLHDVERGFAALTDGAV